MRALRRRHAPRWVCGNPVLGQIPAISCGRNHCLSPPACKRDAGTLPANKRISALKERDPGRIGPMRDHDSPDSYLHWPASRSWGRSMAGHGKMCRAEKRPCNHRFKQIIRRHRRGGRVVEGAPLLREYTSKAYRGFESLPLRHSLKITSASFQALGALPFVGPLRAGNGCRAIAS